MLVCENCKKEYPEDFNFCPYCGHKKTVRKTENICPKCGAHCPLEYKFCPKCGTAFKDEPAKAAENKHCSSCYAVLLEGMKFCAVCGRPVELEYAPHTESVKTERAEPKKQEKPKYNPNEQTAYSSADNILFSLENVSFFFGEMKGIKDCYASKTGRLVCYGNRICFEQTGSKKAEMTGFALGGLVGSKLANNATDRTKTEVFYRAISNASIVPYPGNSKHKMVLFNANGVSYTVFGIKNDKAEGLASVLQSNIN